MTVSNSNRAELKRKILEIYGIPEDDGWDDMFQYEARTELLEVIEQEIAEARIDEHNFMAWAPNERRYIEIEADRIEALKEQTK